MKAFFIDAPAKTSIGEIDEPPPAVGEVLLRIRKIGFCGTDLNTFRGLNPIVSYPRIPGHEIGATIEQVSRDVPEEFQPGKNVTVSPYTNCGSCPSCRQGRTNCCQNNQVLGNQRDGALTSYISVPWEKLYTSNCLSLREFALVEPLSIGFHANVRGRVTSEDTVAVLGCGAIGLGVIAGAKVRKARVIAIDIDNAKLEIAKEVGADLTINSKTESLHDKLKALTDGDGPGVIVEAVGLPLTFRTAVEEVAFAGRVIYIGYAKEFVAYDTKYFILKELDILGSRNAIPNDFRDVIKFLERGRFPVDDVITKTVPLEDAGGALQAWSENPALFTKIQVEL